MSNETQESQAERAKRLKEALGVLPKVKAKLAAMLTA